MIDTNADYPENVGKSLQKDYKKEFQNKASQEYSSAKVNLVNCSCQKYNKSKYNIHERNNKKFETISTENISNKEKNYLSKSMIQLSKYSKMCYFNSSIVINTKDPHSSSEYLNKSFYKNKENNALSKIYMLNLLYMTTKRSSNIYGIIIKKIFYFINIVESLLLFLNKKATSNKNTYNAFGRSLAFVLIVMTILSGNVQNASGKVLEDPHFGRAIVNVTAAVGREAILECVAEQLGNYKVAWLRVDTQTILTIQSHVITKNHRIGVTHSEHRTWYLHVKEVKESDRGWYMCQINTDPMKSQVGYLDIVVPPDILDIETSTDLVVQEGANVSLRCAARGSPVPTIMWKRENSEAIRIGNRKEVISTMGSVLHISRVSRQQMGPYLCIASNGVPPSVSKRIMLVVHFPPIIWIQYQLIGAYDGQQIVLECNSEAFPKSINYWTADKGQIVPNNEKFESILMRDAYRVHMQLIIRDLQSTDYGIYKCISKNSLGETDGTINVYRIPKPSTYNITTKNKNGARSRLITDDDTYQTADFQTDIPDSQHLDVSNRSNLITIPKSVLLLSVLSLLSVLITLLAA